MLFVLYFQKETKQRRLKMKNVLKDFVHQLDVMNTISGGASATSVDIIENKEGINIDIYAPSVSSESFNIFVRGNHLVIYTVVKNEENAGIFNEDKSASRHMVPMFSRVFEISPFIDEEEIDAVFENGKLKIFLPYQKGDSVPVKRIDIRHF